MKTLSTYCVECDREVDARIEHRDETMRIRGQETPYGGEVAVCPVCGSVVADSRVETRNLDAAYSAYRSANDLLSPEEIREIRQRYSLSLRDFSRFLGFGEQTVARYESGALQDETHDGMMRLAASPEGASLLLEIRRAQLPERIVDAVGALRSPPSLPAASRPSIWTGRRWTHARPRGRTDTGRSTGSGRGQPSCRWRGGAGTCTRRSCRRRCSSWITTASA